MRYFWRVSCRQKQWRFANWSDCWPIELVAIFVELGMHQEMFVVMSVKGLFWHMLLGGQRRFPAVDDVGIQALTVIEILIKFVGPWARDEIEN